MKNILLGTGLLAVGIFTITVHENQVQMIKQQEAHIVALETKLEERDQLVSELNKTLERRSSELTELSEQLEESESKREALENRLDAVLNLEATAYTPFCDTGCIGITKTGEDVSDSPYVDGKRVVAVDPNVIPLGTTMTVHTSSGSFDAIAEDTGGDIVGNRIDILVMTEKRANNFGRQSVTVELH
ncbi:3D domain-containing protein [Bacillus phage PK2]|nr:3D domain-containing protein [Bacillus phage PK2]